MKRWPTVGDNPVKEWNRILICWDTFKCVPYSLDSKIWPEWIRISDGQRFLTPSNDWTGE